MGVCENSLKQAIVVNCDEPIVPGFEDKGIIVNRADIDFAATSLSADRKNVIESLVLKTGKKAYECVQLGNNPFTGTSTTLAVGTYRNTFTNTVNLVVLDNDPDVCSNIIDGLANGKYVVILENKHKATSKTTNSGDAAFQVYGWYQGLKAAEITDEKYSEDTDGGWLVSLQETKAPKSGVFLYKTDYETTKTAFESLISNTQ